MGQRMIIVVAAILFVHVIIGAGSMYNNSNNRKKSRELIDTLEAKWMKEDKERDAWQEEQLQDKFGTSKLDRIVYDPRLDVRLAYQKLFAASMSDLLVEVEVDRFDEISIFIDTFSMQETYRLTRFLKESIPYIEPDFVNEIVFTDGDHFNIIDHSQLMKIRDWDSVTKKEIERYCFPKKKLK